MIHDFKCDLRNASDLKNTCDLSNKWDNINLWNSFDWTIKYDYIVANFSIMHFWSDLFWEQLNNAAVENRGARNWICVSV